VSLRRHEDRNARAGKHNPAGSRGADRGLQVGGTRLGHGPRCRPKDLRTNQTAMVKLSQANRMSRGHRFSAALSERAHSGGIARQNSFRFRLQPCGRTALPLPALAKGPNLSARERTAATVTEIEPLHVSVRLSLLVDVVAILSPRTYSGCCLNFPLSELASLGFAVVEFSAAYLPSALSWSSEMVFSTAFRVSKVSQSGLTAAAEEN
jgi:hypothetical protein